MNDIFVENNGTYLSLVPQNSEYDWTWWWIGHDPPNTTDEMRWFLETYIDMVADGCYD